VRELWPAQAEGLEVGVGAGHFAVAFGIRHAVEPSAEMRRRAAARGIAVVDGVAERLPFADERFDAVLMVTAICFVDDPRQSVREMLRVLRPRGCAVIGFVDRDSSLGREYQRDQASNAFYSEARFLGVRDVVLLMNAAGFVDRMAAPDPVQSGHGVGSFVVIRGCKEEASVLKRLHLCPSHRRRVK